MKVTRRIRFDPNKLFLLYYEALFEMSIIIARRLEEEARQLLSDRMKGEKSSGALMDSLQGIVVLGPRSILIRLQSNVRETGQWEEQMGESGEAEYTANDFNYAMAVEEGTGVYGPEHRAIKKNKGMIFWNGEKNGAGNPKTIKTNIIAGQIGLHYGEDAIQNITPQVMDLLNQVSRNIDINRVWVKR